jgi:hypothetical protein
MLRRRAPLLPVLATVVLLAGCGGASDNGVASKPPTEIIAATKTAAAHASSVDISSKANVRRSSFTLDAALSPDASRARVSVLGSTFEVIRTANEVYVKGNPTFTAGLGAATGTKIPPNTWIKSPTDGPLRETASFANIKTEPQLILSGPGPLTKGATTTIAGQPAIAVKQDRKLSTTTIYVATTGEPYPLQLDKTGRETGQTTFTNWNQPVHIDPPTDTIELSQLPKTGG